MQGKRTCVFVHAVILKVLTGGLIMSIDLNEVRMQT